MKSPHDDRAPAVTPATATPSPKAPGAAAPLPPGYLWRLAVVVFLLVGGGVCMLFYNGILGSVMSLAGLAFGKLSGLNAMVASDPARR